MNIKGIDFDFDITSPTDMLRYKQAGEAMEQKAADTVWPELQEGDPDYLEKYVAILNMELHLYGDFMDDVFGDGTASQLLGSNPSLAKVTEVIDAIGEASALQGNDFGLKLKKYTPNRATRRGKK